jgi:hypothetical protein
MSTPDAADGRSAYVGFRSLGFTLTIALLVAVLLPSVARARDQARTTIYATSISMTIRIGDDIVTRHSPGIGGMADPRVRGLDAHVSPATSTGYQRFVEFGMPAGVTFRDDKDLQTFVFDLKVSKPQP